jgi:four helix bundle protein
MNTVRRFEDLRVWQQARVLVTDVYSDFRDGSVAKDYAFRNQVHDAAISTMSNIAEGFERTRNPDRARFMDFAKGSCGEVRSLYYAGLDLGYVDLTRAELRWALTRQIGAGLASFADHLRATKGR